MHRTAGLKGCAEELVPIERLMAGQAFHKIVQSAFLTGLVGVSGFGERPWGHVPGRRGRASLGRRWTARSQCSWSSRSRGPAGMRSPPIA